MPFRLTLCEADTGIVLGADGLRALDSEAWRPLFETEDEALALKDDLLSRYFFAECLIEDLETGQSARYIDEEKSHTYFKERTTYLRYRNTPKLFRVFKALPSFELFDVAKYEKMRDQALDRGDTQ